MNEIISIEENLNVEKRPFFSILIPVFNAGKFIKECIENIQAQNFQDWEAIIVDDCSTDESVSIAEKLRQSDDRIKVFKSDKNSGGPHTPRMRAASFSKGKYVVPIDADDKISTDLLETHYQYIESMNIDLVIPEMWRFNDSVCTRILPLDYIDVSKIWVGSHLVEHTLCKWAIPMAGFAIRREIYLEADQMITKDDRQSSFVDELLSRWLLFLSGTVFFDKAKYFYRYNSQSVTNVNIRRFIESRIRLSDDLINMTAKAFGDHSNIYMRAIENKFYYSVDLLRLINRTHLKSSEKTEYTKKIASSMEQMDLSILKGIVSPRYLAVMSLPIPLARIAFKLLDPIIKLKNGI